MVDEELTGRIIKAFYKVYNSLGHGFIESIYHNAMLLELVADGLSVETENQLPCITKATWLERFRPI